MMLHSSNDQPQHQTIFSGLRHAIASCVIVLGALLIAACGETESTNSPIRLVGITPTDAEAGISETSFRALDWFVDSPFEYTFGVFGGTGRYEVRYLRTAPEDSVFEGEENTNHIEMSILVEEGATDRFTLVGTPTFPDGTDSLDGGRDLVYYIQVDDGTQVALFRIEVRLNEIEVEFISDDLGVNEGVAGNIQIAERLFDSAQAIDANPLVDQVICETIREEPIDATQIIDGRQVAFHYQQMRLSAAANSRVELTYRVSSGYNESQPEFSSANSGDARPGVDYIDQDRTVVFLPGETDCAVKIGILGDTLTEGTEEALIEIVSRTGPNVVLDSGLTTINIIDDEPLVTYTPEVRVINRGESTDYGFVANVLEGQEASVLFGLDETETTATPAQFSLFPQAQVVQLSQATPVASISVATNQYALGTDAALDPRVSIRTQLDERIDIEETATVVFNEWATSGQLDDEIVAREVDAESVVDFAVADNGTIFLLKQGVSGSGHNTTIVSAVNRNGSVIELSDSSADLVFEQNGIDATPIAIATTQESTQSLFAVMFKVDGLFVNQTYGGEDFVVAMYQLTDTGYVAAGIEQYGSELDDEPLGIEYNQNIELLVYGSTEGTTLSGGPGSVINSGQRDGFAYLLSSVGSDLTTDWSRFVGTSASERVVAADIGRTEVVFSTQVDTTSTDLSTFTLNVQDGTDSETVETIRTTNGIGSEFKSLSYDDSQRRYFSTGSSRSLVPDSGVTGSGSEDVFVLQYGSDGALINSLRLATVLEDKVSAGSVLPDREVYAVGGQTLGTFSNQLALGQQDAFFAVVNTDSVFEVTTVTQFGTSGNDAVIGVESVASDKFLVLWTEDVSSGDGSLVYRLSVFAPNGEKLSANP